MPDSQYWMIGFIVLLIILWLAIKSKQFGKWVLFIYFLIVNSTMIWSMMNDQLAFKDAFMIGHIDSLSAINLINEIYLSYYLLIGFNSLFVVLLIFEKYWQTRKLEKADAEINSA